MATGQESNRTQALRDLLAELRELHLRAGEPSMRRIAEGLGGAVSHTTVHSMLRSERLPRWDYLALVVDRLGGDRNHFHDLWLAARRAALVVPGQAAPVDSERDATAETGADASGADADITKPGRHDLVLVSYRLPPEHLLLQPHDGRSTVQAGTLESVLAGLAVQRSCGWVGWDDRSSGAPAVGTGGTRGAVTRYAVDLDASEVQKHHEGYANSTLWPLYHDVIEPPRFEPAWARANHTMNERFAATVARVAARGATVWVHDYQLQLVPAMLRRRRADLRIGFFLHIPWPPVELFMRLPDRLDVLRGVLGADVVGFQRPLSVDNFVTAARHLLDVRRTGDVLRHGGRNVHVGDFPISVDTAGIARFAATDQVLDEAARLRTDLGRPQSVLVGVDRLDYTKGIEQRLEAYRQLLEEKRLARTAVTLVQLATPSRENLSQYAQLRERVDRAAGSLNAKYGRVGAPVVHYVRRPHDRAEIMALYRAADVMLVTPFRDGMNLVAKEYVASRSDNRGVLILSEFAGAAAELRGALIVNPYDLTALKEAIVAAVRMDPDEQARRMSAMRRHLLAHDLGRWTSAFMRTLTAGAAQVPAR